MTPVCNPRGRIVVIDDDPFVLRLMARQLEHAGATDVALFEHSRAALALLEAATAGIEVVFCDLLMPDLDGVQLVRELGRIGYEGALVLMSGEDERVLHTVERLASARNLRVLGALRKPITAEAIGRVLATSASRAPPAGGARRTAYSPDEIQDAVARGELVDYYQPKVDLATKMLSGVEMLLRWQHPRDGLVAPDQFIPVAERSDAIHDLTVLALRIALQQARRWRSAGLELHVAVNVSMESLVALDFPELVAREVDEAGVPRSSLVLEVTERGVARDPVKALDILTRIRLKRIGLSLDDFGTGHSSLAQLRDIPFDELKIDRGFVHGACRDSALNAIFEASLAMARELGMRTVAEGVEDHDDWDYLRARRCDLAQGYFIARPMPASGIERWIARWRQRQVECVRSLAEVTE